ncbi:uncharacterized protein BBOV_IV007585 [Babesia bovis T2Bo]|uniref:Uncharacterized protein n=1 Tax=Babesia bovis TaxID=5865 RepID=S6B5D0_BABBO|nr:uncharacterized protein BBOV_IV007585 [Babesia bovis T2Bo]KAG6439966.1 hypothetical protein BBOV_IV007585 [Babesia bovis T2Bo]BAN64196.1 hypothetical protein [Babesia bovis]
MVEHLIEQPQASANLFTYHSFTPYDSMRSNTLRNIGSTMTPNMMHNRPSISKPSTRPRESEGLYYFCNVTYTIPERLSSRSPVSAVPTLQRSLVH